MLNMFQCHALWIENLHMALFSVTVKKESMSRYLCDFFFLLGDIFLLY